MSRRIHVEGKETRTSSSPFSFLPLPSPAPASASPSLSATRHRGRSNDHQWSSSYCHYSHQERRCFTVSSSSTSPPPCDLSALTLSPPLSRSCRNVVHRHEPPVSAHPIQIIHVDPNGNFIVIDKPGSVPVHPSGRYYKNSCVEILESPEFGFEKIFSEYASFSLLILPGSEKTTS